MIERYDIAGYCRISVDEELDRDNTSIENQKAIIADFVRQRFPDSSLTFYEDRDRSGYTFEQRENYQTMRRELMRHKYDILIVKDFSRFSRRNSRGLVELEDLRDAGIRIISIGDGIDFPNDDDWLKIQFQFLINEMPVTDTSKKVKSVIKRRQTDGKWICAAPYGYIVNKAQQFEIVPTEADIVRKIFSLYNSGWGYKKIANYLTDQGIPTPRMAERERKEKEGVECKRQVKPVWAIVTVQGILDNDFYIGTLRQGKYARRKINGAEIKRDESDHLVFENHHQAIIDYRTFATTRALREKRTTSSYRGVKINDNTYSGFLFCGDCGSPMFAMSRSDLKDAYRCGEYHKRGLKACTSHHIRVDKLDEVVKAYVQKVKDSSSEMLARLNADLDREDEDIEETERSAEHLAEVLADLQEELKATKRQRIRDIMKHPENEETLDETYDELENDLLHRIEGLNHQIAMTEDKRNTIIQVNRVARTAIEVFDDILRKPKLERNDLELMLQRINVYEDHIEIQLKADIDSILKSGTFPAETEDAANFNEGTENIELQSVGADAHIRPRVDEGIDPYETELVQSAKNREDKVFRVSVISNGDPLEIFTDKDGELIFKKYSPIGELSDFAAQICDSLRKATDGIVAVSDRDSVIAIAGGAKRELMDKPISQQLAAVMESRSVYRQESGGSSMPVVADDEKYCVSIAAPVISEGDLMGCVMFITPRNSIPCQELEYKLAQTVASFLGKQMES